ncbi:hypothetical protein [Alishewanella longhuensis]
MANVSASHQCDVVRDKAIVEQIEQIAEHERELQLKEIARTPQEICSAIRRKKISGITTRRQLPVKSKGHVIGLSINLYQEDRG